MVNSALRSLGTQLGRQIARGILGAIMKRYWNSVGASGGQERN